MSATIQLTDALLTEALARRTAHTPSPMLLDRIVTAAASAPQVRPGRRWGLPSSIPAGRRWLRAQQLATAAVAVVVLALATAVISPFPGPGGSPSPALTPSPSPFATKEPVLGPTPAAVVSGDTTALRLGLGGDTGPIDVIGAGGAIWVADIFAGDVRRFDATTMTQLGRTAVRGAAWFAQAGGALWVTQQIGAGITRIDPATGNVTGHAGAAAPCGQPVALDGSIWVSACDADIYMRIDATTAEILDTVPAQGHGWIHLLDGRLLTQGAKRFAYLDPETHAFTNLPGIDLSKVDLATAGFIASDGLTIWIADSTDVRRYDADGTLQATFPYAGTRAVTFAADHAWLAVPGAGMVEVDLATNDVVRTVPLPLAPNIGREIDGVLWVTDFDNNNLWRVDL